MSRVRLSKYFDSIKEFTDNTMLVRSKEGITLAREDVQITYNRVFLWRNATRAAEDLKVHKMHYNHWGYPHYSKGSRISERANKNIHDFLDSLLPSVNDKNCDIDINDYDSAQALCRNLYSATIQSSFSFQELIDRSIKHENDAECMMHIEHLCDFLDFINYETDPLSKLNKIRSSLQDTEHLKSAWKASYFVTDDQRLRKRGEFIYSILGLSTKLISINKLKEIIIRDLKN